MGSNDFYPEEHPVHQARVDGFWMDTHPVTAGEFRRFVRATGYVTVAERPPDSADYPDADPDLLVPGSSVFRKSAGPVPLDDYRHWWEYRPGACWKHRAGKERASSAASGTQSCTWHGTTWRRTPPGLARSFQPRPSGSSPPVAA
jgi:formylglycine-generating enzyme required for sulfatase activity